MTMRTDTKETTFVGNVAVHLVTADAGAAGTTPVTPAFGRDSRQPVDVTSEQLYVNDTAKTALFTGSVVAVQGDSTLKSPELHVSLRGQGRVRAGEGRARSSREESSRLSRLVAKNGAVVTIGSGPARDQRRGRLRRQGRYGAVHRQRARQPAEERAAGAAAVRRPQDRQEPARVAGGGRPAGRPHRRDLLSERDGKAGPAAQAQVAGRRGGGAVQGGVFGTLQDRSQRAHRRGGRHARRPRPGQAGDLPRQRQVAAGRLRRAHGRDDRLLHGPVRLRADGRRRGRSRQGRPPSSRAWRRGRRC